MDKQLVLWPWRPQFWRLPITAHKNERVPTHHDFMSTVYILVFMIKPTYHLPLPPLVHSSKAKQKSNENGPNPKCLRVKFKLSDIPHDKPKAQLCRPFKIHHSRAPAWKHLLSLFCFCVHVWQRSPKSTTSPTKVNMTTPFHCTQMVFILQAKRVTMWAFLPIF